MTNQADNEERKVVRIYWTDTTNVAGGWHDKDELEDFGKNGKWNCYNVGELVFEDDDCYVLAGRRTENHEQTGLIERIPKSAVTKVEEL